MKLADQDLHCHADNAMLDNLVNVRVTCIHLLNKASDAIGKNY